MEKEKIEQEEIVVAQLSEEGDPPTSPPPYTFCSKRNCGNNTGDGYCKLGKDFRSCYLF